MKSVLAHSLTTNKPMVMIPLQEYQLLLKEAGYSPTPRLNKQIREARTRYKNGEALRWEDVKDALV